MNWSILWIFALWQSPQREWKYESSLCSIIVARRRRAVFSHHSFSLVCAENGAENAPWSWDEDDENINDDYERSARESVLVRRGFSANDFFSFFSFSFNLKRRQYNSGGGAEGRKEISKQRNLNKWSLIYVFLRGCWINFCIILSLFYFSAAWGGDKRVAGGKNAWKKLYVTLRREEEKSEKRKLLRSHTHAFVIEIGNRLTFNWN